MKRCERAKPSKNIMLIITLLFSLLFVATTVLAGPGKNSTLPLQSGTINPTRTDAQEVTVE